MGYFHYNIGDLVEFVEGRVGASRKRTGIIIAQRFRFTTDNQYKIKTEDGKAHWVSRPMLTLLSEVVKG